MKRNRLVAQILLTVFLASLPGIVAAAGTVTPIKRAKYTVTGDNEMTIESGRVNYSLQNGTTYTFKYKGKEYKVTACGDSPVTSGYATVEGDQLVFYNEVGQLCVTSPTVAAGGTPMNWLIPAGVAVAVGAGVGLGLGLSGHKDTTSGQ